MNNISSHSFESTHSDEG